MSTLSIGFHLRWNAGSLDTASGNVVGDELYAESLARAAMEVDPEVEAAVYAPNRPPERPLDVMIYMNDDEPVRERASFSVLYMQNAYGSGSADQLRRFQSLGYDGYAFISARLLDQHRTSGHEGIYLPFGVDLDTFHPHEPDPELAFDVAYVGNDIKGRKRTEAFIAPAVEFNLGLFGNWKRDRRIIGWRDLLPAPRYKRLFERISRGKIPQARLATLYSSAGVILNCTAQDCVDWDVMTLRTLEVLACDGFLISDRVPMAEKLLGDYVAFTDGHADLRRQIRHYLAHPDVRQSMARAGGAFVREHFSVRATARRLIDYLRSLGS